MLYANVVKFLQIYYYNMGHSLIQFRNYILPTKLQFLKVKTIDIFDETTLYTRASNV